MVLALPYGEYEYVIVSLNKLLATEFDSKIGCFVDVDWKIQTIRKKTRDCPLYPESERS